MKKNTKNKQTKKFSKGTIITHWLTAVLILLLFPMGKYMEELNISEKMGLIKVHAILGIAVLILTILRTIYYFKHQRPAEIDTGSKINNKLAVWVHNAFYYILLGIAISGIATIILGGYAEAIKTENINQIKAGNQIPALKAHGTMATIMMLLLLMHIIGFIKHLLLKKENTLKRII